MGKRSHQIFKDKAKNRVADLEEMISGIQSARKESRTEEIYVLEEQVHQMLREWKAELDEPSPATSLLGNSHGGGGGGGGGGRSDLSLEIENMLRLADEQDDATSKLDELIAFNDPKPEPVDLPANNGLGMSSFRQGYYVNQELAEHGFLGDGEYKNILLTGSDQSVANCMLGPSHLSYQQINMRQEMSHGYYLGFDASGQNIDMSHYQELPNFADLHAAINPPPSAFLWPKCALWDCQRSAQRYQDYCSDFHSNLARNEGPPAMTPVLRPGGIELKDGPLFSALTAKTHGKNVGIPECVGAATAKSPWNAPDLFDLSVDEGESLREWLFFDKPRRAFESGPRKQRSLPDYNGRGWHESRKQVMKEYGGMKRSYYMDPQPLNNYEWHLFEYEINNCVVCALYRLELKLVDGKKSTKAKVKSDPLADLQQQMGRLNAENAVDSKRYAKGRATANGKDVSENFCATSDLVNQGESGINVYHASDQMAPMDENPVYGPHLPYGYSVDLQQQMGRLNAENAVDSKRYAKGRATANGKDVSENFCATSDSVNPGESGINVYHALDQMAPMDENPVYGPHLPYGYSVDLQQQMERLNAENAVDSKQYTKGRATANGKDVSENFCATSDSVNPGESGINVYHASDQMAPMDENPVYGPHLPYGYSVESLNSYYGT